MYDAILCDADGTLFDFESGKRAAMNEVFAALGLPPYTEADDERYRRIDEAAWRMLELGQIEGDDIPGYRAERFLATLPTDASPDAFGEMYLDALSRQGQLLPGALALVRALRDRGARLAIVTNGFSRVQRGRLEASALRPYIDALVVSQEIGAAKPRALPFERALERLGCTDHRCALMVGDSYTADIEGARAASIDACWYNPARREAPGPAATYVIHDLMEVLTL